MAHIESFSTAGLDPRHKLAFWNDRASESFSPLVSEPEDIREFNGSIVRGSLGDLSVAEVYSDAQIVRHSRSHVARTKNALFFLQLQLEGESTSRQDGRESNLQAGDFNLCDSTRRYDIVFTGPNRMLVLGIPNTVLRRQVGCPESLAAISMPGERGASGLLSQLLRKYWREYHQGLDEQSCGRVAVAILDLIGAAYADLPQSLADRSTLGTAHRIRIINYIEAHLSDPDLTPTRIAEACRMTTRYLHHLFSDQDETVARYILRRRLEACSRALQSASQRGRTVTAIAFDYGFNSPTHFGRVFRAKFNVTPREYRRDNGCPR
ncbi:MAG TPA: helix-turn-helix domain-containing protein [Steroidobacteraceae bacterium]|nr:helix-turn-helix domain-containing protein [Steroidobacteraceae bacterium]